jgi:hypothetical protein
LLSITFIISQYKNIVKVAAAFIQGMFKVPIGNLESKL